VTFPNYPQDRIAAKFVAAFDRAASGSGALVPWAALSAAPRWRSWPDFALRLDAIDEEPEGGGRLQRLGARLFAGEPFLGAVGAVLPEVHPFSAWVIDNLVAPAAPVHVFRYEVASAAAARVTVTTLAPHHLSRGWWPLCAGLLEGLPQHLGLPPSAISYRAQDRSCVYSLALPPADAPRKLPARASREEELRAAVAGIDDLREHLVEQVRLAGVAPPRVTFEEKVAGSARGWRLSPREAEALACVVRGLSNKETAAELGCAITTAELHVTRVLRKSGSSSRVQLTARFWSAEGEPSRLSP
jgi:DNA-binding CsgD family transcriptional regulator